MLSYCCRHRPKCHGHHRYLNRHLHCRHRYHTCRHRDHRYCHRHHYHRYRHLYCHCYCCYHRHRHSYRHGHRVIIVIILIVIVFVIIVIVLVFVVISSSRLWSSSSSSLVPTSSSLVMKKGDGGVVVFVHHCSMTLGSLVGNCHTKNQKLPKPYLLLKINVIYLHKDLPVQQTFEENKTTPTCVKVSEINEPFTAFLIKSKHFLKFPLPYFSMLPELSTRNPMSILVLHSMQRQKHDKYQ